MGQALGVFASHSLIGSTQGALMSSPNPATNILNQAPGLGPLADNGGPT